MPTPLWVWIGFTAFVISLLALDVGVMNRRPREVPPREAALWVAGWVTLALGFNTAIYMWKGHTAGLEFLTAYIVEYSLSVDNLFVFLVIFGYFMVPREYRHKVLFWGILGAVVMRGTFIGAGMTLIHRFHWMVYLFGAFLIFTGIKLWIQRDVGVEPERNPALRLCRRLLPITEHYEGARFFLRRDSMLLATPLFVVVLVVETTDVMFALDSIPAVIAVTRDPFLAYTSNVLAVLGLRALYFLLQSLMGLFTYLKFGLSFVLVFIGMKMALSGIYEVPIGISLGVVASSLIIAVAASLLWPPAEAEFLEDEVTQQGEPAPLIIGKTDSSGE